ncbi:MAG: hypothetical protein M1319_04525 [Chloroflexi bacterium]|nr:hypothetical protein [Chloroflexota bacterium]
MQSAKQSGNVVLVDAGDAFSDIFYDPDSKVKAELIAMAMGKMGYDAFNIGENELRYGQAFLKDIAAKSGLQLLSANLRLGGQSPDFVKPYIIKDVGGIKVGIIGIIDPNVLGGQGTTKASGGDDFAAGDTTAALSTLVPEVRKQASVVIVLAHTGYGAARTLAETVPGIDAVVVGHGGMLLDPPVEVGKTVIVQAGTQGKYLGQLDLSLDANNQVIGFTGNTQALGPDVTTDPDMAKLVDQYKAKLQNPGTPTPTTTTKPTSTEE